MSPQSLKFNELVPTRGCNIIPCQVLDSLLSALHIHLSHPFSHQLKMVTQRYLFVLDMDKAIKGVTTSCIIVLHSAQFPLLW